MNKEKKMLKKDMDAMSYKEALDLLRFDLDMRTFDPMTGESYTLHHLKSLSNHEEYPVYVAISKCIELLENISEVTTSKIETIQANVEYHHEVQLQNAIFGALSSMLNQLAIDGRFLKCETSYDAKTDTHKANLSLRVVSYEEAPKCNI